MESPLAEGAIEKTAQINMTVHIHSNLLHPSLKTTIASRNGQTSLSLFGFQSYQPLLYLLAPRRRSPTHRRKRTNHLRLSCHLRKTLRTQENRQFDMGIRLVFEDLKTVMRMY